MAVGQDRIKTESPSDIAARCPICGDSKYSKNKARLHLYEKNGKTFVNCFNECSCVNKPVSIFLRDYFPNLYDGYKREMFRDRLMSLKTEQNENRKIDQINKSLMDDLQGILTPSEPVTPAIPVVPVTPAIPKTVIPSVQNSQILIKPKVLFDLNCFTDDQAAISNYYTSRGLTYRPEVFGKSYIAKCKIDIDGKSFPLYNFIVIPFYCDGKWYGFYSRSLTEHRFYTYMPDSNTGFKVWNIYNININETVYVFEGIFDALAAYQSGITNVVACCGAKPGEIIKQCNNVVFCLDNDRTGIINSIKYLKNGFKVVNWSNSFKDCNEMLLHGIDIRNEINNQVAGIVGIVKLQNKL